MALCHHGYRQALAQLPRSVGSAVSQLRKVAVIFVMRGGGMELPVGKVNRLDHPAGRVDDHQDGKDAGDDVELSEGSHRGRLDHRRVQRQHQVGKKAREGGVEGVGEGHRGLQVLALEGRGHADGQAVHTESGGQAVDHDEYGAPPAEGGCLLHLLLLVQNAGRALVQDSQEGQTELLVLPHANHHRGPKGEDHRADAIGEVGLVVPALKETQDGADSKAQRPRGVEGGAPPALGVFHGGEDFVLDALHEPAAQEEQGADQEADQQRPVHHLVRQE
mmetsp:Transcript_20185/g.47762  ORF Transcript_20185/g.47762 Transcript_20185/m.47762 type:complete len:276 (-) Transcript_20185:909-1736(-)